ncbi:MAG: hypothetical protein IPI75_07175 [Gammaproteobacteria bacterium]|nr:hypothetical protein [Gammaproteobacteria bacterium]
MSDDSALACQAHIVEMHHARNPQISVLDATHAEVIWARAWRGSFKSGLHRIAVLACEGDAVGWTHLGVAPSFDPCNVVRQRNAAKRSE